MCIKPSQDLYMGSFCSLVEHHGIVLHMSSQSSTAKRKCQGRGMPMKSVLLSFPQDVRSWLIIGKRARKEENAVKSRKKETEQEFIMRHLPFL